MRSSVHLVDWDTVCSPISEGGLGIRNVRKFNQALLGKWLWRYAHEEDAWWRSVLVAKYMFARGDWRSCDITEPHGVGLWKFICMGWRFVQRHFRFDTRVSSKISFWEDVQCGESSLKDMFLGCLALPDSERRPLQIMWSVPTMLSSGTLCLLD
jgi:hypothetical protein